jgi:hypothetical protein
MKLTRYSTIGLISIALWLLVSSLLASDLAYADSPACKPQDSVGADAQPQPKTWQDLYRSYTRYRNCDDGALAEAYSGFVVYLLTEDWDQLEKLPPLIHAHPKFGKFVLHHVDELMTPDQAKLIERNAIGHCPTGAVEFCGQLIAHLESIS